AGVLLSAYEAAVRAWPSPGLAESGLRLARSRLELLSGDHAAHSRALLFATACGRTGELRDQLRDLAVRTPPRATQFACWMAAAKLSLVRNDLTGVKDDSREAVVIAHSMDDTQRARRLRRAAHWLTPPDGPRISQWQLRELHYLLPLDVAMSLEDRDARFMGELALLAGASPAAQRCVDAAGRYLRAAEIGREPRRIRKALGGCALRAGRARVELDRPVQAIPYTGAAWRLLQPELTEEAVATHARAIALACRGLGDRADVRARLDPVLRAMALPAVAADSLAA